MAIQGLFTGGVKIRNLNGYLIAVDGLVYATTNTGGTTVSFFYQAKTGITSGDPGSGHLIWNNATQTSATQLNVSHLTDTPIEDIDLYLAAIVSGNKLIVQDRNDSERFQIWTVTGTPTHVGTTYWTIPVTLTQSAGAAFTNNHDLLFAIVTNSSGGGGITTNSITFNNSGSGAASGTSFNGGVAQTISYNTIGAQAANANLTSLAGLSYSSASFVKMTGANTFTLDTNTYLTANQTITLSGDVSGSGTTAITTTIGANKVTNAMLAQIATARIRGRVTAGTGNVEDLTGTQATTLLDTFTTSLKGLAPASGGGTTNFLRADGTWAAPAGAGTTTNSATFNNSGTGAASGTTFNGGTAVTISYNTIGAQPLATNLTSLAGLSYVSTSFVKMTAAGTFSLDTNTYLTANQTITLSGDVSGSGTTAITTAIGSNKVTNAMLAQVSTATFHGRVTAGTGNIENLTGTQATTLLDVFTSTLKGLAPASGGGTTNFLRADGTWAAPSGGGGGTPGGSNRQIQYNNSGAFGADANFSWSTGSNLLVGTSTDNGTDKLQVNGSAIATLLKINTNGETIAISNYKGSSGSVNLWIGTANTTNTSGFYNNAVGTGAMASNTSGSLNNAMGISALNSNTTGSSNTAVGVNALVLNTSGNNNTGIGDGAFRFLSSGSSNVAIGKVSAGFINGGGNLNTLNQSIFIGEDTRASADGNTNEMVFGHNAIGQGSNTVTLGNSSITKTFLRGSVMVNTTTDNGVDKLQVNGSAIATTLKITGGTSSQVLYADGSVKQITSGTASPSGGNDGDIYLQYV